MNQHESIRLIELYKNYPVLYNQKDKSYRNKAKREDAWVQISKIMKIPTQALKEKMKVLMGTYRSEKSREKKKRLAGLGTDEVYNSKWFAFKSLDFLDNKDSPGAIVDSVYERKHDEMLDTGLFHTNPGVKLPGDSSQGYNFHILTTSDAEQSQKKSSQKRKRGDEDNEFKIPDDAFKTLKLTNDLTTDSYFIYGQHIANELRKYDYRTLSYVKKAFADVLFEADMGNLCYRYHPIPSVPSPTFSVATDDSSL